MNASSRSFSPANASGPAAVAPAERAATHGGLPLRGPADGAPTDSLFRLMAESWPAGLLILDRELCATWANAVGADLTRQSRGALAQIPWGELHLPWSLGRDLLGRLLTGEQLRLESACHRRRDDSEHRLRATLIPIRESGDAVTAIACLLEEDAPSREPASEPEADYKGRQRRLEAALESAQGGVWDFDLTQRAARRTEFYFRMLGDIPHEEPVGVMSWRARVHPDDLQRVESAAQAVIEGRNSLYEAEYRYRHADGSWRWLLDRGRVTDRDETGKATRMVGFVVDITDRVRTQQALRQSEFRYRTVASMAPGFVFEHRLNPQDGTAIPDWASDGIEAVFGCKYEEMENFGGWLAFVDEEYRPMAVARQARLATGEPQSGETQVLTVQGQRKWLHVNMLPVRDPQTGSITGVLGSAYDITTRKLAEQALLESEAVLRAVTQNTPDWLFLVDENLIVRFVNRQFGPHDAIEMIGRPLLELVPEAHRPSLQELYLRVFASGRPGRIELRHSEGDGNASHHEHRVVPVIEGGNVRSLTVAVTDVTERKRAEAALRESQMTLQTVAASSADWLALFDRQRRCIFLNRAFRGIAPEAWLDAPVENFAPPADRARVHEIFEHVMKTGEPRDFDQMILDSERGPRYLELRARAVQADGRIFGAVVNITEVTERHAQQDAMRTQSRILETMQEGVVLIDAAGGVVKLTNPMFARMFGYDSKEELMGRSVESLFSTRALQRSRAGGSTEVLPVELECARKDGTRFVAACIFTRLRMGGANHWLAVFNDVTERKRLEREIIEVSNREQQRIGSDLHDGLGQELTGIALMLKGIVAQLRKEGSAARLDVEDVIALVNNAVESTRALARGLSPVSGERGGLAAALQALATRASERYGIHVEFDMWSDEPLRLNETAATHVYRIVQEALTNVIRHSAATGVDIRLHAARDELHLTVDDNGRGFSQPDPESPGGLGLKIMQYRTQMLGGELTIDSGARGGVSIHCSFPMERAAVAEREQVLRPEER
jgi:PAS domain S-box-containing protein